MCGGTTVAGGVAVRRAGLSPRVRGNRAQPHRLGDLSRSIPACAGEPRTSGIAGRADRVYPRVCGGTPFSFLFLLSAVGLSPRVRGNRLCTPVRWRRIGSIPACAGEPEALKSTPRPLTVYPRVCGGTAADILTDVAKQGLSPRVRGNLQPIVRLHLALRSIPACAGEPLYKPFSIE